MKRTIAIHSCAGFTYIGLLIVVAIMGVTLAEVGTLWSTSLQRAREQQLLFIGNQFSRAITAYVQNTPFGKNQFPKNLEDLLQDKRQLTTVRYLRKLFADPMTGNVKWGLIKGADGGIIGVHSLSEKNPIKKSNFASGNEIFVGKNHYSDWRFIYKLGSYSPIASNAAGQDNSGLSAGAGTPTRSTPATTGTPLTIALPTNPLPPPYRVPPPPPPLPPDATPNQRRDNFCQITLSTDATICANVGAKFGDAAGATCMASARARNASCMSNDLGAEMPTLVVQYE